MIPLRDKITNLKYSFISGDMPDECLYWFQLQTILFEILDRIEKLEKANDRIPE